MFGGHGGCRGYVGFERGRELWRRQIIVNLCELFKEGLEGLFGAGISVFRVRRLHKVNIKLSQSYIELFRRGRGLRRELLSCWRRFFDDDGDGVEANPRLAFLGDLGVLFFLSGGHEWLCSREGGLDKDGILENGLVFGFLVVVRSAVKALPEAYISNPQNAVKLGDPDVEDVAPKRVIAHKLALERAWLHLG